MHPGTSSFQNASVYPIAEFPRPAKVVVTAPAGSSFPFACETETVNEPPAPPNNTHENDSGALSIKAHAILCGGIQSHLLEPAFYDGVFEPAAAPVFEENPF
jgi:hypothetical protein